MSWFYIYNHEKVAEVHSLPAESTIQRPRVQARGQWAKVQRLVGPTQQPLQQALLQGLHRTALQPLLLLQQAGLRQYQGTPHPTQPINFPEWKDKIITKGLVDKVQVNYEDLSSQEYDLQRVFDSIFTKDSKSID